MWFDLKIIGLLVLTNYCDVFAFVTKPRSFVIDYENDTFLKDGQPFRYISGGMHYFRVPSYYWEDRLKKAKALGLNAIQTYIPWNFHELNPEYYDFEGEKDLVKFIDMVNDQGLLLILRPGPYIDAEWEFGGFPWWLAKERDMKMRTSDQKYMQYVKRWFNVLLSKLIPKLYKNGGPVIAFQIENEYGNYYACDKEYLLQLKNIYDDVFGENSVVLFTTDGYTDDYMQCGTSPIIFKTIDFGTEISPEDAFKQQRKYQTKGPLVNSEYYTGWVDYWGKHHQRRDAIFIADQLEKILMVNASVNLYMLHGGTNFGFMNGVDIGDDGERLASITSYDYDAPISEAGDTTWKYFTIRDVIKRFTSGALPPVPPNTTKSAYPKTPMMPLLTFEEFKYYLNVNTGPIQNTEPLPMADLDQSYGYVIYTPKIPEKYLGQKLTLIFEGGIAPDEIIIIIDGNLIEIIEPDNNLKHLDVFLGHTLDFLIVNEGRAAYAPRGVHYLPEMQGIFGKVRINGTADYLNEWSMYNINDTILLSGSIENIKNSTVHLKQSNFEAYEFLYQGIFLLHEPPADTFIRLNGFHRGQLYINDFNVGRFRQDLLPQETLYIPKPFLHYGLNTIVVFSLDPWPQDSPEIFAEFLDHPVLD